MPKVEADHNLLLTGRKKPTWWHDFTKEWAHASIHDAQNSYVTNAGTWTCSCPAYLRSRFLLCKHLIAGTACPAYRAVIRNRHPPFLQIRTDPDRHIPQIGGELQHLPGSVPIESWLTSLSEHRESFHDEHVPEGTEDQDSVHALLQWTYNHVANLKKTHSGSKQIQHIEKNVLKRLLLYRERVEKSMRQRSAPKTWEHADLLFLP